MADAAETDGQAPGAAPAPPFPIKLLIIVSVIALVFGVGGAVVAVKLLGGSDKNTEHVAEQKGEPAAKSDGASGKPASAATPGVMVDLDPFIVNLADVPDVRYLKLTVKLEVDNDVVEQAFIRTHERQGLGNLERKNTLSRLSFQGVKRRRNRICKVNGFQAERDGTCGYPRKINQV